MINLKAPYFRARAFYNEQIQDINLLSYNGKWVVLFFYPADFTFVCPTELRSLAENYEKLKEMGVEVLSISTDTEFAHKAWHKSDEYLKSIKFPMIADPGGKISKMYGTYLEDEGLSIRATFIIDPEGIIKAVEMNDNAIGRNTDEIIRKIQALQFVRKYKGELCPVNWKPGDKTLKENHE